MKLLVDEFFRPRSIVSTIQFEMFNYKKSVKYKVKKSSSLLIFSEVIFVFLFLTFPTNCQIQADSKSNPTHDTEYTNSEYEASYHGSSSSGNVGENNNGDFTYYDMNGVQSVGEKSGAHSEGGGNSGDREDPRIYVGPNGPYYSAKNPFITKYGENTAYSDYDIYKQFYLNPNGGFSKSNVKFKLSSRIVQTRYGSLQGIVLPMAEHKFLKPLEVFLGVPYATPPVGPNRFSPTRTPSPWDGIRVSDRPAPVCPQNLPDISNEPAILEKMPKGRLEYLKRLIPHLKNQSEDCLYMNIYSPLQYDEKVDRLPVLVFVHGESFAWGAGGAYDGAVLAAYADAVVITINFRLGLLGFLNANPTPHLKARVANYGLMDQIAALHWIQQNIALFGGDPSNITMLGHGAGAACINFLMISPTVMPDLFHRAVLLSGSALSSWAIVEDPVFYTIKLAKHVNCTIPDDLAKDHEIIVDCLRDAAIEDLLSADISPPNYLTAFGPSVDGVVIKTDYAKEFLTNFEPDDLQNFAPLNEFGAASLNVHNKRSNSANSGRRYQNKYDLMFGVVNSEALSKFSAQDIQNGFESERRDKILRTYVRNAYTYHLSEIFYTVVNEYTDWERTVQHPMNTRDSTVAALSDAQYVAPLVQSGDMLSAGGAAASGGKSSDDDNAPTAQSKTYFYVFDYQTKDGDYPQRMGTVHGEELPYLFGAPLVDGFGHFPRNYTKSEVALSEAFILYIANFARTGNPNDHFRQEIILAASRERNRFRANHWEEYDSIHQKYLEIGMKPKMKNHFRAHQLSVWLRLIPELHRAGMEDVVARHNLFRNHNDPDLYEGQVRPDPLSRSSPYESATDIAYRRHQKINNNSLLVDVTTVDPALTTCVTVLPNSRDSYHSSGNSTTDTLANFEAAGYAAYSTALSVTIAIGCSLLILNVLIFAGVYYQRDKSRSRGKKSHAQHYQTTTKNFDTISAKHPHFHIDPTVNPSIVVDVETPQGQKSKNNASHNQPHNMVNLNFKGPGLMYSDTSVMQIKTESSMHNKGNMMSDTTTLPHKSSMRNTVANSSFRQNRESSPVGYQAMSGYATLPKNPNQYYKNAGSISDKNINQKILPPNGSATLHFNVSETPDSRLSESPCGKSSQNPHGTLKRKPPAPNVNTNMPQAAMSEMRV